MPASGSSARRFAQVVFEIAKAANRLEQWETDLQALSEASSRPDLAVLLRNPRLPVPAKRQVLREALPAISDEALNLATLLMSRGRLEALIGQIVDQYGQRLDEERNLARVEVVSAVELEPAQRQQIEAQLAQSTGKQIRMETRVDPKLVGGMVIRVGYQVVDGSVRSRLEGLRRSLAEVAG